MPRTRSALELGHRAMQWLKELRPEAKLTQKQLAELVGVSERTIIFWEKGTVLPSFEALQRLYEVLGSNVQNAFHISRPQKKRGRKPKGDKGDNGEREPQR